MQLILWLQYFLWELLLRLVVLGDGLKSVKTAEDSMYSPKGNGHVRDGEEVSKHTWSIPGHRYLPRGIAWTSCTFREWAIKGGEMGEGRNHMYKCLLGCAFGIAGIPHLVNCNCWGIPRDSPVPSCAIEAEACIIVWLLINFLNWVMTSWVPSEMKPALWWA